MVHDFHGACDDIGRHGDDICRPDVVPAQRSYARAAVPYGTQPWRRATPGIATPFFPSACSEPRPRAHRRCSTGDYLRAREMHEQHRAMAEELGGRAGVAAAWCNLGICYEGTPGGLCAGARDARAAQDDGGGAGGPRGGGCSPKMQWRSLLALADLFVINRPHTWRGRARTSVTV